MQDRKGERFGRYEILSELGRGAMGVVYKARDPRINRVVAVKTISLAGQPPDEEKDFRARFLREAEAAGRLSHPGIVTIFDAGEEAETHTPYLVMEFVGGQSLDKLISSQVERKLSVETALQLAAELADALDYAHVQGVVHRDLKPENILLTEDGHAKIADFGVAKLNLSNQTLAGRAMGTPAYMSPEQLNGDTVDGRSDLFSLGVLLYTMLTGFRPFQGNSAVTICYKVVNRDPIPASVLDAELPAGLDHVIARAMAKDAGERYQRGSEMLADLQLLQNGASPDKPQPATPVQNNVIPVKLAPSPVPSPRVLTPKRGTPIHRPSAEPSFDVLKQVIRKKSFAGAVLLAGVLALAIRVISFGPKDIPPKAAGPIPQRIVSVNVRPSVPVAAGSSVSNPDASEADLSIPPHRTQTPKPEKAATARKAKASTTPPSRSANFSDSSAAKKLPLKPVSADQIYPATKLTAAVAVPPPAAPAVSAAPLPTATLAIEVDHKFSEAQLSIWVDDQLSYSHALQGTDKKRLGVFHHVQGHEVHTIQLPSGKHTFRVQVTAEAAENSPALDKSTALTGEVAGGKETVLHIGFDKHGEIKAALQ